MEIHIPNQDPDKHMNQHETLTVIFDSTAFFDPIDQREFLDKSTGKYITKGTYPKGKKLYGDAQRKESVNYYFNEVEDQEQPQVYPLQSGTRTIVVGSVPIPPFQEILGKDEDFKVLFCECWPCTESLLKALLNKLPIPGPVKEFLEKLIEAGDKAHAELCPKRKS